MAWDFKKIYGIGGLASRVKAALDAFADITNGHDHDGVNSRLVIGGTPSDGSVTAVKLADNAVETAKIKDKAVTAAKLADATKSATIADGTTNVAAAAGDAPTAAEFNALVTAYNDLATKHNSLIDACEKLFLTTS